MNLETPSRENIAYILDELKRKLEMANHSVVNADAYNLNCYEDLLDLYHFVNADRRFTINEIDAIAAELGKMRRKK